MFKDKHPARFSLPKRKVTCQKLATFNITKNAVLEQSQKSEFLPSLHARSYGYNDEILDTSFSTEQFEFAVKTLNCGKGGGADELQAEHLKYGGQLWLQCIFNVVIQTRIQSKAGCNCSRAKVVTR